MRQRNTGPYPLIVPDIPAEVAPGDEIDFPDPVTGFEPVIDPAPDKATKKATTTKGDQAPSTEGA